MPDWTLPDLNEVDEALKRHRGRVVLYSRSIVVKTLPNWWVELAETCSPDECWIYPGKSKSRARELYILLFGELPREICVCHHCDIPKCCNPKHWFLGTNADNLRDMFQKGRDVGFRGKKHTEETKRKIAVKTIQFWTGRRHSTETKLKISQTLNGRSMPLRIRQKISAALKGVPKSEEHCQKLRVPKTLEHRQKIGAAHRGRPKSEEHRRKIADTLRGRKLSDEHRRKLSEGQRRRYGNHA